MGILEYVFEKIKGPLVALVLVSVFLWLSQAVDVEPNQSNQRWLWIAQVSDDGGRMGYEIDGVSCGIDAGFDGFDC